MPRIPRARYVLDVFFVGVALSAAAAFAYRSGPEAGRVPLQSSAAPLTAAGTGDLSEGPAPSPRPLLPTSRTRAGVVAARPPRARPVPEEEWCGAGPRGRSTVPMRASSRRRAVRGEPG